MEKKELKIESKVKTNLESKQLNKNNEELESMLNELSLKKFHLTILPNFEYKKMVLIFIPE